MVTIVLPQTKYQRESSAIKRYSLYYSSYLTPMKPLRIACHVLVFILLTALTQIGGVVYFGGFFIYKYVDKYVLAKRLRLLTKVGTFLVLYCFATFVIIPLAAMPFGRERLPVTTTHNLRPLNMITCLLNRNYVTPELRRVACNVADKMATKYPGTLTNYLDANFPFFNGFGLLPHLSHNDGKKLDLSFCYNNATSLQPTNDAPSFIGYGICEEPKENEVNTTEDCGKRGYWQYNVLRSIVPQGNKARYVFNEQKTRDLVMFFANEPYITKIFIEPHLKTRLHLTSDKIRFQGCHAVRHDDHVHVQLR